MQKPFFVWQNKVLRKINPEDVICLSTEGNYTRIYVAGKTHYMVRSTLSAALKKLPRDVFIKIHRSFVVSVYHIDSIHKDHLLIGDEAIPIAKQYYKSLMDKLNIIE
jgi:DNA-binding LytR/AlgR family response regulator